MASSIINLQAIAARFAESSGPQSGKRTDSERTNRSEFPASASPAAKVESASNSVTFEVDSSSGQTFIQVIDRETGEVVRQIPPEEFRKIAEALDKITGQVIDELV